MLRSSFFLTLGIGYRITPLSHFELARGMETVFDFPMLRLRTTFDDPLFVRTNRGLTPTQRALELAGPLRERLAAIEALLQKQPAFDLASTRRRFRIAAIDYVRVTRRHPLRTLDPPL